MNKRDKLMEELIELNEYNVPSTASEVVSGIACAALGVVGLYMFLIVMSHEGAGVATATLELIHSFPTLFGGQ